jgi:hypothetical protein
MSLKVALLGKRVTNSVEKKKKKMGDGDGDGGGVLQFFLFLGDLHGKKCTFDWIF